MTIWFSSDFHFNHVNITGPQVSKWKSGYRNFRFPSEMNDIIIDNLNEIVKEDDVLYYLGDFAFGDKRKIPELRSRIVCKTIHYVHGNHDQAIRKYYNNLFTTYQHYIELCYKKILFCIFHYPIGSWNEMNHGSINTFGHCHQNYKTNGKQIDVGVEGWDYKPISIDFIIEYLKDANKDKVDHH